MLPTGIILIWAGAIVDIPNGFVICDGNNGTPDLRNRFIVGAGNTYAVNETGGSILHDHDFTSQPHYHTFPAGVGFAAGAIISTTTGDAVATGTTNTTNGLPPYFALAYIMKT